MSRIRIIPFAEEGSFEEFLDRHDLKVEVRERGADRGSLPRWYADIPGVEISDGFILTSTFGQGNTPEAAVHSLRRQITGARLVRGAYSRQDRREFNAPTEWRDA